MNQAIQFLEDETLDTLRQSIIFSALVNGHKRFCAIRTDLLFNQFGEGEPLSVFQKFRWDIEEMAEKAIVAQCDDEAGYYWLSK